MKNDTVTCFYRKADRVRLVYCNGKEEDVNLSPSKWLESLILPYGSTLQGRIDAFRQLMHVSQKPCILISERSQLLYFPTKGADNMECQWFLYQDITSIHKIDSDHTGIMTHHGLQLVADVNIRTIRMQMKRCSEFLNMINPV